MYSGSRLALKVNAGHCARHAQMRNDLPPIIRPPTPTAGFLPPTTVSRLPSRAAVTSPQRRPEPRETEEPSFEMSMFLIFCRSRRTPLWPTFDHPGLGAWPPLRTANLRPKKVMTFMATDTSFACRGRITQFGSNTHARDLQLENVGN